ncbi:MAG: hydantoinase B/oxoprolinase family protein [Clostridium sp.]|nr:hydantoinase B/oxoprolinase family protein [Clostridium sp.]
MENKKFNPVTLDIVKDSLIAISNEIFYAFAQTSMSPIIYETLDYASGIADADGLLLTQGNGASGFIGMIAPMIDAIIEKYGKENLHPGDVYIINDPFMGGGTHKNDIGMVLPVFCDDEIIAFIGNKAHWSDVGGMAPGSFSTDATNTFQEGLTFSGVKLVDRGELVEPVWDLMKSNVRYPMISQGDMWGQISSLRTGERRVLELCKKYGVDVVKESMARLIEQGEMVARKRLAEFPKGSWEMDEYMDDDGHGKPLHLQVKVTITDDEFLVDFSGSDPQVMGSVNSGSSAVLAGVKIGFMSIIGPELAVNDGVFAPLRCITEQGSVLQADPGLATSTYYESMLYALDLVWRALAPVFPESLGAGHLLSVCTVLMAGKHQDFGNDYLIIEPTVGGWGACMGHDGQVGQFCVGDGETYNVPVEMAEIRYGIRIPEHSLHCDGAGAGEFRGGAGAVRTYLSMNDNQSFTASFGRNKWPAWGAAGGKDGSYNYFVFHDKDGTVSEPQGIVARRPMNCGDMVRMYTATGGGYGNPLKRPAGKVAMDVKNEYITAEQAKEDYGVIVDEESFAVIGVTDARAAFEKENGIQA